MVSMRFTKTQWQIVRFVGWGLLVWSVITLGETWLQLHWAENVAVRWVLKNEGQQHKLHFIEHPRAKFAKISGAKNNINVHLTVSYPENDPGKSTPTLQAEIISVWINSNLMRVDPDNVSYQPIDPVLLGKANPRME